MLKDKKPGEVLKPQRSTMITHKTDVLKRTEKLLNKGVNEVEDIQAMLN
jgi:hypothetical protein